MWRRVSDMVKYLTLYQKFTDKSAGKRILKIDDHLAKLKAKVNWQLFFGHCVYPNGISRQ